MLPDFISLYESDGTVIFKVIPGYEYIIYLRLDNFRYGIMIDKVLLDNSISDNLISLIQKEANIFCCNILLGK